MWPELLEDRLGVSGQPLELGGRIAQGAKAELHLVKLMLADHFRACPAVAPASLQRGVRRIRDRQYARIEIVGMQVGDRNFCRRRESES